MIRFWLFLYLLYTELCKFVEMEMFMGFLKFLVFNFDRRSLQASMFFKFVIFFLLFFVDGLLFPLFSSWACIVYFLLLILLG